MFSDNTVGEPACARERFRRVNPCVEARAERFLDPYRPLWRLLSGCMERRWGEITGKYSLE